MANVKDGATGTVLTAPSPATSGLSLVLNSGEGARMPTPPFYAIAHPNNTIPTVSTSEKILVTAVATDTLTIVRAQGIYSAQSIAVGWRVSNAIFQDDLNNASIIKNEVPTGSVNGSNTAFTVASAGKVTGSLELFKNGIRMKGGGADYTETATGFTMVTAPVTGTVLLCGYVVAGALQSVGTNSFQTDESVTGLVNSSNTAYTTARAYIAGSLEVYINGLKQMRTTDYTETTPGSGIFTMIVAPITGDIIRVNYQFNLNPSSNADTVDGIHANTTATANQLFPLDSNGKIPTSILKPSVIDYTSSVTTDFSTTSATYVDVTGASTTYASGSTAEKLYLWLNLMGGPTVGANVYYTLSIATSGSTDQTPAIFSNAQIVQRHGQLFTFNAAANTTYTIKLRAQTSAGTLTVYLNDVRHSVTIKGFAISQ